MSSPNRLRIRLNDDPYKTVMAEAERRGTDASTVIEGYVNAARMAGLGADRIYGSVLGMKSLLHRILAQARVKGVDLENLGLPINALSDKLNALHRLILELNGVDLNDSPQADLEPMTLERELKLEIEQERFYDLGQDDAR